MHEIALNKNAIIFLQPTENCDSLAKLLAKFCIFLSTVKRKIISLEYLEITCSEDNFDDNGTKPYNLSTGWAVAS